MCFLPAPGDLLNLCKLLQTTNGVPNCAQCAAKAALSGSPSFFDSFFFGSGSVISCCQMFFSHMDTYNLEVLRRTRTGPVHTGWAVSFHRLVHSNVNQYGTVMQLA